MRILIVEDERNLNMVLSEMLTMEGYYVDSSYDGIDGLDNALSGIYDIIILDIMLPKKNGIEVLSEIRKNNINTPVLMLTARSEIEDKISGLDNGADDYLTKPFNSKELLARIRALLRRREKVFIDENLKFADITIDKSTHEMYKNEQKVKLTKKEYDIMELLILNKGKVVAKEDLTVKIWGYNTDIEYNSIEVYISFLRKKLRAIDSDVCINTIRSLGYIIKEQKDV
ncbi:response regulator transcription factor [Porcipelethomonas sp.]|uniref:response regulator transcription factor n=1 Tax=Porcipelethomonas sp. TaxID=2981675 RepID=UPI003EF0F17B